MLDTMECDIQYLYATLETKNIVNDQEGDGYDNVESYIPIAQPNAGTLTKIDAIEPSDECGDSKYTQISQ
jgi:ATP-dependent DNA helicase 2 subunit 2